MDTLFHKKIIEENIKIYDESTNKHGISSSSVLLDDQQTQYLRFQEIIKYISIERSNTTILDVGCGNCELYKFLNFSGFRGRYTGFDINEKLIAISKERFKNIDVRKVDILEDNIDEKFDYVVMSGLFNLNAGQSKEWVFKFIEKMFSFSDEALIFNMISDYVNYKEESIYYQNPQELLAFCLSNLSKRVTLAHHNLPFNFTICIYKNDQWVSANK